ncbi:hypothetical protein [Chryseobacterium viscerum]|uniref:DUF2357 domain-containing protein n=1 Tax=Chryseobacterium viscerum TaxID=1037377 RepID=A0A5N4BT28_9FLAO|nr:hypothetical protein [Chryseobacterium viscerum]KAB1231588.1 hypothetical protein F8D52_07220 [Chryseobacterium viscerum]
MSNELKIKIITDSQGNDLDLSNITIEAADALKVFIDSMVDFAKTYSNTSNVKLKLDNGSIETALVYPDEEEISNDIDDILSFRSSNQKRVEIFRTIQDKIQANGLTYQLFIERENEEVQDVTDIFKGRKFRKTRQKIERSFSIEFIKGELWESGGKNKANIHIENHELGAEYKVECSKIEAKKLNDRLYSNVYLSVCKIIRSDADTEYRLIDSYLREGSFNYYKQLHEYLLMNNSIEKYDVIYNHIVDIFKDEQSPNEEIIKIIRLYNNDYSEKGILRTILMTLKPIIKKEVGLLPHYEKLAETFRLRSKTRKI